MAETKHRERVRKCIVCGQPGMRAHQRAHVECKEKPSERLCKTCGLPGLRPWKQHHDACKKSCPQRAYRHVTGETKQCKKPGCVNTFLGCRGKRFCSECTTHAVSKTTFAPCQRPGCSNTFGRSRGRRFCDGCRKYDSPRRRSEAQQARLQAQTVLSATMHIKDDHDLNLAQTGAAWGVTRERARQIECSALKNFHRNWRILYELAPSAGVRVDWDWLFGKKQHTDSLED